MLYTFSNLVNPSSNSFKPFSACEMTRDSQTSPSLASYIPNSSPVLPIDAEYSQYRGGEGLCLFSGGWFGEETLPSHSREYRAFMLKDSGVNYLLNFLTVVWIIRVKGIKMSSRPP